MHKKVANPIDWPVPWDRGAPEPFVIASDRLFLIYYIREIQLPVDPLIVKMMSGSESKDKLALVEFLAWTDFQFGGQGESAITDHPFIDQKSPHNAYVVNNSSSFDLYDDDLSGTFQQDIEKKDYKHYVFAFHDEVFECIANSYVIEVYGAEEPVHKIAFDRLTGKEWWMKTSKSTFRCPNCGQYLGEYIYSHFCMNCGKPLVG